MHRVFCTDIPAVGETVGIEPREAEHLFKVFRAREGDAVEVLDGRGVRAQAVVEKGKILRITGREVVPEPEEKLHLCCALPRKQKLDQLLKQAVELGAWSIHPVKCMRSVAEGGPRERWDMLLREACKQSGNPFLPVIGQEAKLPEVLEKLNKQNIKIYYGSVEAAECGEGFARDKAVLIGPEGGFAPEELEMMKKCNAEPLNLGPYVLRLETAAACALAVLRFTGVMVIAAMTMLLTGCGGEDVNPMIVKGQTLRESGDYQGARDHFRRAVAEDPDNPAGYLALAQVCDENLNEPLEAIYAYQVYLTIAPLDAPERIQVQASLALAREKAVKQLAGDMVPIAEYMALEARVNTMPEAAECTRCPQLESQNQALRKALMKSRSGNRR